MTKTNLTIAVPSYGEAPSLFQTLSSIIDTNETGVEILVLDDASPTNHIKRVSEQFGSRVSYTRNEKNLGISGNFNRALELANSSFVQIIGQDDMLSGSSLEVLQSLGEDSRKCFAIQLSIKPINQNGKQSKSVSDVVKYLLSPKSNNYYFGSGFRDRLLFANWTYFPGIIWNKDLMGQERFSTDLKFCMDLDLLIRLSHTDGLFYFSNAKIVKYRRHWSSASMSGDPATRLNEELELIKFYSQQTSSKNKFFRIGLISYFNYFVSKIMKLINLLHLKK